MLIGLTISTTGVQAASSFLDVTSNNIANSATTGFKTQGISFQDLLYTGMLPGSATTQNARSPTGSQIGNGVTVSGTTGLFTQGTVNTTGNQFDVAINGQGFFAVRLSNGTTGYTRAGNFSLNANGQIVTADGFFLAGGIVVPTNASSVNIGADGTVTAVTPTGTQTLGTITLTQFQNPPGLTRVGDTTFVASPASGAATTDAPGSGGTGTLEQKALEASNVSLQNELINLIVAQSTFQYNTQALQIEDETLQTTVSLISLA